MERTHQRRLLPTRVELRDGAGNLLGTVLMVLTHQHMGPGAETVYLNRESVRERLRQTA